MLAVARLVVLVLEVSMVWWPYLQPLLPRSSVLAYPDIRSLVDYLNNEGLTSTTTTRYEKIRSGLLLQLWTVHHGRLALVRCQLQNPPTSYLVGQRVVVVLN